VSEKSGDILVATPQRWDEACFALPAIRALAATGMTVGVLCPESQAEFWQTLPTIQRFAFSPKCKAKLVATKLYGNWQASLAWEADFAAETFKLAAIPRRLGPTEKKFRKWLTQPLTFGAGPLEHRVRYYLAAIEALGIETARPEFFLPYDSGIAPVAAAVLLCPDSDYGPSHEWPLARWQEVAAQLIADGKRLTVANLAGGRGLGQKLAEMLGEPAELFHATPLGGILPVLAVHRLVIAADSSLPHLAAHAGATCITLFGPNDPHWKRPLGRRHRVARRHVECAPCLLAKCPLDQRCQQELNSERVLRVIASMSFE
jgi:ADP-heptose:LPS heptosyltransferase